MSLFEYPARPAFVVTPKPPAHIILVHIGNFLESSDEKKLVKLETYSFLKKLFILRFDEIFDEIQENYQCVAPPPPPLMKMMKHTASV